ncbi:PH domain-containing protein [Streptomyces sp. NPDC088725]|uniref:PH domain-containing protein n=1 Tax=Streptomyces sp. NPDC088725 TaxID=3365873 RepID=UPI003801FD27
MMPSGTASASPPPSPSGTEARQRPAPADETTAGRLNSRLILVNLSMLAAPVATFAVTTVVTGGDIGLQGLITLASFSLTFLVIAGISVMRLITTRYWVTADRVELRSGLLFRSHRSIPVDRVRGVDLTANPLHRLFGLTSVRIGTGEQSSSSDRKLSLDGISEDDAVRLRREIIERREAARGSAHRTRDGVAPILTMDWAWLRYAPLTVWGIGGVFLAAGSVYRTLDEMRVDPLELAIVKDFQHRLGSVPLWFGVLLAVVVIVAIGVIGSTATFVEGWSRYGLEREEGGNFRIRRGLLITRSTTIEERRLRGVEVSEPMLLRWAGGARLSAVAGGLGSRDENRSRSRLTPPVPRRTALAVAADILKEDESPTAPDTLVAHPRVALRRRINRGVSVVVATAALFTGFGLWLTPVLVHTGWVLALVLLPAVVALAYDAYRTLGHGLRGNYLVARAGAFAHRTVALRRDGIIGWSVSRSLFQRRAGLLTLGATTGAGNGVYKVRDVAVSEGLAFAEEAVPELLAPFIERGPGRG